MPLSSVGSGIEATTERMLLAVWSRGYGKLAPPEELQVWPPSEERTVPCGPRAKTLLASAAKTAEGLPALWPAGTESMRTGGW